MWIFRLITGISLLGYVMGGVTHAQTLNIGTAEWRPWQILNGEHLTGITPDILQELSKRTGYTMNVTPLPHKRLMDSFKSQQVDLEPTVNPAWRDDQKDISVYTTPYFTTCDIILVRKESGIKGTCASDFKGKSLGCGLGYYYPEGFQAAFDSGDIVRDDNPAAEKNLKKLLFKRIDGAILDKYQARYLLKIFNINPDDFETAYEFQPSKLSLRLHKSRQSLLPVLNKAIEDAIADGTVERIVAKYSQ